MIKKIDELSLEEINRIEFLTKEDLKKMSFAELCIYQENLNKIKARYDQFTKDK